MTITSFSPVKKKLSLRPLLGLSAALFIGIAAFGALLASRTVDLRHEVARLERERQELLVRNADLKDELFSNLSASKLLHAGVAAGFVLERNPEYVRTHIDPLAIEL